MKNIEKTIKELHDKFSLDANIKRNDERMRALKEELEWFRSEALTLHNKNEEQKEIMKKMKNTIEILEEDRDFFH